MELVSDVMITTEDSYFVLDGSPYPSTWRETSRVVKAYVSTIAKKPTPVKSTDEGGGVLDIDTFQQCYHFNARSWNSNDRQSVGIAGLVDG